jgi:hypothetical protein
MWLLLFAVLYFLSDMPLFSFPLCLRGCAEGGRQGEFAINSGFVAEKTHDGRQRLLIVSAFDNWI